MFDTTKNKFDWQQKEIDSSEKKGGSVTKDIENLRTEQKSKGEIENEELEDEK